MEKSDIIKQKLADFNEQVGWDNLKPEDAKHLSSLLVGEAHELWEEIAKENKMGINKYDISLEVADVYIYLQKICLALDIDMLNAVEDKMMINKVRFLNEDYQQKRKNIVPKQGRCYKISNMYKEQETKLDDNLKIGQIIGLKNGDTNQKVLIFNSKEVKAEYMLPIVGVVHPRNEQSPLWIASDVELSAEEINEGLKLVDFLYDIELV